LRWCFFTARKKCPTNINYPTNAKSNTRSLASATRNELLQVSDLNQIRIESYLCEKVKAMQFELRPTLFWDVNVEEVDLSKHRASVIERVATRGRLDEFRAMVKFYGQETVKNTLVNARHLDKRTLSYCSLIFDVPITEFRCYKLAQLNPEHWNY